MTSLSTSGRVVEYGIERIVGARPRHHHVGAYATVVLAGRFEQASYCGRHRPEAGDILVQPTLDRHAGRMLSEHADVIRLPWRFDAANGGVYRGCDVDLIGRLARRDTALAADVLALEVLKASPLTPVKEHWADGLAIALARQPRLRMTDWAEENGLVRESVSRGFQRLYGVNPARYRLELRARAAWLASVKTTEPFADLAAALGYSDQPHMTRAVSWLTNAPPAAWRRKALAS